MLESKYEFLRQKINNNKIDPPQGKTADQLTEWFLGYQSALFDILTIIGECECDESNL